MKKVFIESLGCPKNRVDSEIIAASLIEKGWTVTDVPTEADLVVINSCSFIKDARVETIGRFFELNEGKKRGAKIALTGCLVQLHPDIKNMIPEADFITGIDSIGNFAQIIEDNFENKYTPDISEPSYIYSSANPRVLTLSPFTAYVKIADGCDNFCSYCSIPFIRGRYRERSVEDIVNEVEILASNGVKEIVLISQDTTKYGSTNKSSLVRLLNEVNSITGSFKIRVMYLYPSGITQELVETIQNLKKVAPYFEIPVQHISDTVLNYMNRPYTGKDVKQTVDLIRKICGENCALRTTFISSFPKETQKDHEKLIKFIEKGLFDYAGVFKYSKEERTESFKMRALPSKTVEKRFSEIEKTAYITMEKKLDRFIGMEMEILYEGIDPELKVPTGRGWHQAPEIDGITIITDITRQKPGTYVKCRIISRDGVDFIAETV
jgi:ribosomal protein S12 methylthiotransferase